MTARTPSDWTDRNDLRVGSGLRGDSIDRSQETYEPAKQASRVIPPSGDVTPDGAHPWPRPGLASKILVWGGIGAAAAAVTAGSVLAVRAVVDAVAGDDDDAPRRRPASKGRRPMPMPRNAYAGRPSRAPDLGPRGTTAPATSAEDRAAAEARRAAAARRRTMGQSMHSTPGLGLFGDVNASVNAMTGNIRGTLAAVTSAIESFKSVASQAGTIASEFRDAADQVRTMLDTGKGAGPKVNPATGRAHSSQRTAGGAGMVDLRDGVQPDADRMHRL